MQMQLPAGAGAANECCAVCSVCSVGRSAALQTHRPHCTGAGEQRRRCAGQTASPGHGIILRRLTGIAQTRYGEGSARIRDMPPRTGDIQPLQQLIGRGAGGNVLGGVKGVFRGG